MKQGAGTPKVGIGDALERSGHALIATAFSEKELASLCEALFHTKQAGQRCLLDDPLARQAAKALKQALIAEGVLNRESVAIQAIAFDKNPEANWSVPWHQDVMFPLADQASSPGYERPCVKDGVPYARPPRPLLERLLAVRLHLDDCDPGNGPLRVVPGSHGEGILSTESIPPLVASRGERACAALRGQALLMRPLLLHASSRATAPSRRRVLHFVYDEGGPLAKPWHRSVA